MQSIRAIARKTHINTILSQVESLGAQCKNISANDRLKFMFMHLNYCSLINCKTQSIA